MVLNGQLKIKNMRNLLILISLSLLILTSCGGGKKDGDVKNGKEADIIRLEKPQFDADSAFYFVEKQVEFGTRVPGTNPHKLCGDWLISTMEQFADEVVVQSFTARLYNNEMKNGRNIISIFNPDAKSRILLGAHWDTRPYADHDPNPENHNKPIDGANDGASGVGVLMEVARQLSIKPTEIGVDIIFFDLEDWGEPQSTQSDKEDTWCLGSQHWSKNFHKPAYNARFGILLDMVGAPNAKFAKEGTSTYYAPDIVNKVWDIAAQLGFSENFISTYAPSIVDDHMYVNKYAQIPMIDIIQYEPSSRTYFNNNWHTMEDNIDGIDKFTLQKVGQVVLAVIYNEK